MSTIFIAMSPITCFPGHRCSTNNYRTHRWISMMLRKEMRCWDCKALPTQASSAHLASEPVDSKTLGAGVSRHSPRVSLPAAGNATSTAIGSAQVDSRCWACLWLDGARGDLAQAWEGLADGRAQGQGPGESRKATALPLPTETQRWPIEPLPLATRGPRGCVGWGSCLNLGSPRQRFKHKRFIWGVMNWTVFPP